MQLSLHRAHYNKLQHLCTKSAVVVCVNTLIKSFFLPIMKSERAQIGSNVHNASIYSFQIDDFVSITGHILAVIRHLFVTVYVLFSGGLQQGIQQFINGNRTNFPISLMSL